MDSRPFGDFQWTDGQSVEPGDPVGSPFAWFGAEGEALGSAAFGRNVPLAPEALPGSGGGRRGLEDQSACRHTEDPPAQAARAWVLRHGFARQPIAAGRQGEELAGQVGSEKPSQSTRRARSPGRSGALSRVAVAPTLSGKYQVKGVRSEAPSKLPSRK